MGEERHLYRLISFIGQARCQNTGCPNIAVLEAIYVFQHASDADATQRRWPYCGRHATGFAQTHRLPLPMDLASDVEVPSGQERSLTRERSTRRRSARWSGR